MRLVLGFCLLVAPLVAQKPADPSSKPPRTLDGKPSLSGVWEIPYTPDMSRGVGALPFTEWGAQDFKSYDPARFDYTGACLPMGWTRLMNTPMPMEIMQEPDRIAILFEAWQTYKVIPTDGREHPKNLDQTWQGHSVGRWEGDTLVVDSVGFNEKTRLDTVGHPHSDQLHVIERFTRADAKHIAYEVTVIDPKAYKEPFTNKRTFTLHPEWELMEYSCEENNKDTREGHINK
jgi:hypothetical protein